MLVKLEFIDKSAVLEASELGWRPNNYLPTIDVFNTGKFKLSQVDRLPDGSVAGWVYKCGQLSLTVVND